MAAKLNILVKSPKKIHKRRKKHTTAWDYTATYSDKRCSICICDDIIFNKLAQLPPISLKALPRKQYKGKCYAKIENFTPIFYTSSSGIIKKTKKLCWDIAKNCKNIAFASDFLIESKEIQQDFVNRIDVNKFFQQQNAKDAKYLFLTEAHGEITTTQDIAEDKKKLLKKAAAKHFTTNYVKHLVDYDSPLNDSYKKTLACAGELFQNGNKISAHYCKQRWCTVCNRIRTGKLINGYIEQLNSFPDAHFLTLTLPNVHNDGLDLMLKYMQQTWRNIHKITYKKFASKKEKKIYNDVNIFKGVKKLECTYNVKEDTYHPHYHFIFYNKIVSEFVRTNWINMVRQDGIKINPIAQDLKQVYGKNGCKELFKYFTKIATKTNEFEYITKRIENSIATETVKRERFGIIIPAIDTIFKAMYKKRVYEPIGIRAVSDEINDLEAERFAHLRYQTLTWSWNGEDWITNDGEALTNFTPSENIKELLTNIIF